MLTRQSFVSGLYFSLLLAFVALVTGCGEPGPATVVSGKVTLGADPVKGTIHFVGADGKEVSGPIGPTGGLYTVTDPPLGEVTVLFKSSELAIAPPLEAPPAGSDATKTLGGTAGAGVAPPKKYADGAGGIKYTVTAGKQQKDFELTP
jgi:hypothetical protein